MTLGEGSNESKVLVRDTYKAEMDIVIPNENEAKDEKKNEKYITIGIAIETEENDVKIGFI